MKYGDLGKSISEGFIKEYRSMVSSGIITDKHLVYFEKYNLHSILQYCLIKAGENKVFFLSRSTG